ncbi:Pentatricopeptide repeat-containing protein [Thalictrum thalictroides]|uniref:Pentatricopeptide repeat-containing protein n=1 Tax=Thalictrum thalictroides TaxID=46969 RepID=A0A7J6X203_THATH|nr:Pentatricopeptide repeat-containing protein [Thalictrum thalictroides]
MLRWYFLNESYWEVIWFYRYMKECLNEQDNIVFSEVLTACVELRDLHEGRKLHGRIVKVGNPDSFVYTGLSDMYAKCGEFECSCLVFEESPERNVVSWTSMIVRCVQNDCAKEGMVIFDRMRHCSVTPNLFTLGSLLTACKRLDALHQGKWVHGCMIKLGVDENLFVVSSLLDMYLKCGTIMDARLVFDELEIVDLVSWTTMIVGYTHRNLPNEALMLFTDKKWAYVLPNSVTIASALSACAQMGKLNLGKNVHSVGTKLGLEDSTVKNALVNMYAKCCRLGDASYIFETYIDKDVVAWNSMIAGYSQNGYAYKALVHFHRMRYSFVIDAVTMVNVLSACVILGALRTGSALHAYALQDGLVSSNVFVGTALVNLYFKCGDSESARRVFDEMGEKNTVTWSSMMSGYGMHGDASGSLTLFGEMLKENLEPNDVVFTNIISACGHAGMIVEGWKYFESMCKEHRLVPSIKHYVCMIDLLARSGRLDEALGFIERMPIQADARVWGALLHGCRLHSRLDIGEVAVRRMVELQPDTAGYYVLMSNLYASDGRWEQVNEMRELMKKQGLNKSPGWSLVEMYSNDHHPALRVASAS